VIIWGCPGKYVINTSQFTTIFPLENVYLWNWNSLIELENQSIMVVRGKHVETE
jgi:hypothetical protein